MLVADYLARFGLLLVCLAAEAVLFVSDAGLAGATPWVLLAFGRFKLFLRGGS